MLDENPSVVSYIEKKIKLWKNYIENLFENNREEKKTITQENKTDWLVQMISKLRNEDRT